jgi:hypothetical protein
VANAEIQINAGIALQRDRNSLKKIRDLLFVEAPPILLAQGIRIATPPKKNLSHQ